MSTKETFSTAFNCMDGRTQVPAADFLRDKTGADYIDTITEPGIEGYIVAGVDGQRNNLVQIRKKLLISTQLHDSSGIGIFGHEECAGNPVSNEAKEEQLAIATRIVEGIARGAGFRGNVYTGLITRSPEGPWVVNPITVPREVFRAPRRK